MTGLSFSWLDFIQVGGIVLIVLSICALVSWIVILERFLYFRLKSRNPLESVRALLRNTTKEPPLQPDLSQRNAPIDYVLYACLESRVAQKDWDRHFEETKSRAIAEKIPEMERYLNIQASLGTVSPYLGLLGTVFGIIRAFTGLGAQIPGEGINTTELNAGIAEALVATAAGLIVAIPATIAYNVFRRCVQAMVRDIEIAAAYLKAHILNHTKII